MSHYLCVDCGGSKTSAVICDDGGHIRGRAWGGPSNFAYIGLEAFTSAVQETIRNALKSCSSVESTTTTTTIDNVFVPPTHTFSAAWFGVSGVDSPAAIASITPILSAIVNIPPGPRLFIENDTCLLAAPVSLYQDVSHCVACIAGTGSICVSFVETDNGRIQKISRVGFSATRAVGSTLDERRSGNSYQKPIPSPWEFLPQKAP
jgi:N-acetylglucosamine kinase-like BadF-type ATPase